MIYLLIYLVIGMIYAGVTFGKTMNFSLEHGLSEEEMSFIRKNEFTDELRAKCLFILLVVIGITLLKIPFYPIMFFMKPSMKTRISR